jgi:uncharacterized protein (TIGR02145 family)
MIRTISLLLAIALIMPSFIPKNENTDSPLVFGEVKIGNQVWMSENINTDKFNNGDAIRQAQTIEEWVQAGIKKQPVWCFFKNDSVNGEKFGRIYNWYAATDPRGLAPKGWRIPNNDDWMDLSEYLGGERIAGKKMKSREGWSDDGNGTNESGFNGLPGGGRYANGSFVLPGESSGFWSSNQDSLHTAWFRYLTKVDDESHKYSLKKAAGMYVRCIKIK